MAARTAMKRAGRRLAAAIMAVALVGLPETIAGAEGRPSAMSRERTADDLKFAEGWKSLEHGDWDAAVARFREVLEENPELTRVRLDLALALFSAGRDMAAAYHFRQTLGDPEMPEEVKRKVLAFLERIERRRKWSFEAEAGLARDSNMGSASDARRVELFGFPAELSEESRPKSGTGVLVAMGGDRRWALDENTRLVASVGLTTRTYSESRFSSRVLRLGVGPRFLSGRNSAGIEFTASESRVAGEIESRTTGMEISGSRIVTPAWRIGGRAGVEIISYERSGSDSVVQGARLEATHIAGRSTQVRMAAGVREERGESKPRSWREFDGSLGVVRELPGGFDLGGTAYFGDRRYEAPVRILGPDARRDRRTALVVSVSNRRLVLAGFVPRLSAIREWGRSNLALHRYRRSVIELGLVRRF